MTALRMRLQKLADTWGVDRAIAYTALSRGWSAASGVVTLLLLTHFLTRAQQGFYYTFADILALQVFFELGLATVIIQYASHERAHLEWQPSGVLAGDPAAHARLASLLRFSLLWYGVVSLLVVLVVLPTGLVFFKSHTPPGVMVAWQLPWLWIVLVTASALALSPLLALLEGCGLVTELAAMQVGQNIVSSLLFWAALVNGWGLYTAPFGSTVMVLWSAAWLWRRRRALAGLLAAPAPSTPQYAGIDWRREVWPFQWKIGVSWLCGYFIFRLFNPILFVYYGPVAAGRMGLSLSVMTTLTLLALAWMTTKSAPFGMLIARQEYEELDRRFFPCLWQSLMVIGIGSLLVWLASVLAQAAHWSIAQRILSPAPIALLGAAAVCNHALAAEATYLRAHKKEPFLPLSLATGVLTALSSLILGRQFGIMGMMAGYFVVSLLALVGGTLIFVRKRAEWHQPGYAAAETRAAALGNV